MIKPKTWNEWNLSRKRPTAFLTEDDYKAIQLNARIAGLEEAAVLIAERPVLVKHLPLMIELKNEILSLATKLKEGTK